MNLKFQFLVSPKILFEAETDENTKYYSISYDPQEIHSLLVWVIEDVSTHESFMYFHSKNYSEKSSNSKGMQQSILIYS